MAEKKMTRATAIALAIAAFEDSNVPTEVEALEVLRKMYEQLTKPKAASTAKSKTALENEGTARQLYALAPEGTFDSKYVMEHTTAMTPQKVVGIMRVGIALGLFEKLKEGKKTVYRKID